MTYLKDTLLIYKKTDLTWFAKKMRISKISSLNKKELAEKIASEMLSYPVMRRRTGLFTDEQIRLFEKAMRKPFVPTCEQLDDAYVLNESDYAFISEKDFLVVAEDVKKAYAAINTPDFHRFRREMVWLVKCLDISNALYGVAPVDVVLKVYRSGPDYGIDRENFLALYEQIPEDENPSFLGEDILIDKNLLQDDLYKKLLKMQADKDFYTPTRQQVEDYAKNFSLTEEKSYQQLQSFFQKELGMSCEDAGDQVEAIWTQLSRGYEFHEIMEGISKRFIFPSQRSLSDFMQLFQEANNHTRMLENRGHTPQEISASFRGKVTSAMPTIVPGSSKAAALLREAQPQMEAMGFQLDLDTNAGVVGSTKVYPNDPCPCGSGKKYKKCCGKC